jgi:hypothetical protein
MFAAPGPLHAKRQFYGFAPSVINAFGMGAGHVSSNYFAGKVTPREVLRRHTVFGFASLGLSEPDVERWSVKLTGWGRVGGVQQERMQVHVPGSAFRWCQACAEIEVGEYGFAAWHVLHQLPFVLLCPTHMLPLQEHQLRYAPVGEAPELQLPGEMRSTPDREESMLRALLVLEAYRRFLRHCVVAFREQTSIFRQEAWSDLVVHFFRSFGSEDEALSSLEERLCFDWAVRSSDRIGDEWRWRLATSEVLGLKPGATYCSATWQKVVIYDAMIRIHPHLAARALDN